MTEKKSFVLYNDSIEQINMLSDEQAGRLLKAIYAYNLDGTVPDFDDGMVKLMFSFIKNQLDRDSKKWDDICKKRAEAGRKGGKQKKANAKRAKQTKANQADNDNDNENVNVNDNVSDNEKEKEKNNPPESPKGETNPSKHGEYRHVLLTQEQYQSLISDYGEKTVSDYIRKIDEWVQLKGRRYKDYSLAIRNWIEKDKGEESTPEESHSYNLEDYKSLVNSFG